MSAKETPNEPWLDATIAVDKQAAALLDAVHGRKELKRLAVWLGHPA